MAVFRRLFALAFVCLASLGVAQLPDQQAAARVLGPRWKELSRSAGMVFRAQCSVSKRNPLERIGHFRSSRPSFGSTEPLREFGRDKCSQFESGRGRGLYIVQCAAGSVC